MAFVNFSTREITSKIVYYGPGLCGKTTSLQHIYDSIVTENKGQMVSLATDVDRTIYFDFLPVKIGKIQNFTVRIQLYTVPGQVRYNSTRKLVLSGTDGVVFVADSQAALMDENLVSYNNLCDNVKVHGQSLNSLPHILQFNKRDLSKLATVEELDRNLNRYGARWFETCATSGMGILEGLKFISKLVMKDLNKKGVVDRRRVRPFVPRSKTDTFSRPLVGALVAVQPPEGTARREPDAVDPFYQPPGERVPFYDRLFDDEDGSLEDALSKELEREHELPPLETTSSFSFSALFDDPELSSQLRALETSIQSGEGVDLIRHARLLALRILDDEAVFPPDMPEASKVTLLGVSLRRYAHFQRLLAASMLDSVDCLFILHFLTDLQIGKTIG